MTEFMLISFYSWLQSSVWPCLTTPVFSPPNFLPAAGWPISSLVTVATNTSWRETDTKASTETTMSSAPRLTPTRCSPFVGSSTRPPLCLTQGKKIYNIKKITFPEVPSLQLDPPSQLQDSPASWASWTNSLDHSVALHVWIYFYYAKAWPWCRK